MRKSGGFEGLSRKSMEIFRRAVLTQRPMAWRLFTLFFVVATSAQAGRVVAFSASLRCPQTVAQRANPTFFVLPLPFSDELLAAVVKNPFELTETMTETEPLRLAKGYRRRLPAEAEPLIRVALKDDLTEFGQRMRRLIAGRRFVDLGCGRPNISYVPRIVAEAMGASAYVGVDIRNKPEMRVDEFCRGTHFASTFVQQDMAAFLSNWTLADADVFYLSGIEARDERQEEGHQYASSVKRLLRQLTTYDDVVIVGDASPNFVTIAGFELILRSQTQRVFLRKP